MTSFGAVLMEALSLARILSAKMITDVSHTNLLTTVPFLNDWRGVSPLLVRAAW